MLWKFWYNKKNNNNKINKYEGEDLRLFNKINKYDRNIYVFFNNLSQKPKKNVTW